MISRQTDRFSAGSRTRRKVLGALAVLAGFAALAVACSLVTAPASGVRFSHKKHADAGVACGDCHTAIAEAKTVERGKHVPREADCLACHEDAKAEKNCALCHTDPAHPKGYPARLAMGIRFSHADHMGYPDVTKQGCATCHAQTAADGEGGAAAEPPWHATCMGCHRQQFRDIGCERCHLDLIDNPQKPLSLFDHEGDFLKRHGGLARSDGRVCEHCHKQDDCAQCHSRLQPISPAARSPEAEERGLIHRHDFVSRHAIEARAQKSQCLTCHKPDDCSSCHQQRGVMTGGTIGAGQHPTGWMTPGSPDHHGHDARADAALCSACHERGPATNCIACHRVGAGTGSPHPPSFQPNMKRNQDVPCIYCHR